MLVKVYSDGKMTRALDSLPVGHAVEFKGPVGRFEYLGAGRCAINGGGGSKKKGATPVRRVRRFVMVCAGSGVTPIYAVLSAVMKEKDHGDGDGDRDGAGSSPPTCLVLDGNRAEPDILLRDELDRMAADESRRCKVIYTLSRPGEEGWQGLRGRMDRAFFEREVGGPPPERDTLVLVCGPEGMERVTREAFLGMGWDEEDLIFF